MQNATPQQRREYQAKKRAGREQEKQLPQNDKVFQKPKLLIKKIKEWREMLVWIAKSINKKLVEQQEQQAKLELLEFLKKGRRTDGQMSTDGKRRFDKASNTWKIVK